MVVQQIPIKLFETVLLVLEQPYFLFQILPLDSLLHQLFINTFHLFNVLFKVLFGFSGEFVDQFAFDLLYFHIHDVCLLFLLTV